MRWLPRTLGLAAALVLAPDPARAVDAPVDALSAKEVARLLAPGPWPPGVEPAPPNRASGDAAAVAFGRRMFHEPRLSARLHKNLGNLRLQADWPSWALAEKI